MHATTAFDNTHGRSMDRRVLAAVHLRGMYPISFHVEERSIDFGNSSLDSIQLGSAAFHRPQVGSFDRVHASTLIRHDGVALVLLRLTSMHAQLPSTRSSSGTMGVIGAQHGRLAVS